VRPTALRLSRALVLLAALLVAASACGQATATRPCWKQVQDDWTDNGAIDSTYKPKCYDQAIKKLPRDLFIYSDAPDVISAAKQSALKEKVRTLQSVGGSSNSGGGGNTGGGESGAAGPIGDVLNAGSTTTDGMPLPLLILGGVAILLLAAGAVGVTSRHVQARRTPPPE
jgi:hypothetical protein